MSTIKYVDDAAIERVIDNTKTLLSYKQDTLTWDSTPTASSANPVTSGGLFSALTANGISALADHGLSENDYTDAEKTKLGGIASGAQVNVLEGIVSGATEFTITSKKADIQGVNNLTNYYLKSETYTQAEVNALVAGVKTVKFEIVQTLPTASATTYFNTSKTIYMVRNSSSSGSDYYEEYVTVRTGTDPNYEYSWEKIGDTQIDLSGYVPTSRTINGYALTSNITLSASDVGAATTTDISNAFASKILELDILDILTAQQAAALMTPVMQPQTQTVTVIEGLTNAITSTQLQGKDIIKLDLTQINVQASIVFYKNTEGSGLDPNYTATIQVTDTTTVNYFATNTFTLQGNNGSLDRIAVYIEPNIYVEKIGNASLTTTAQTLSAAVNELVSGKQNALPTTTTAGKVLASTTTAGTVEWIDPITTTEIDNYFNS